MVDEFEHIIINGEKTKAITIKPTEEHEYAPIKWEDQNGYNITMMVAHEVAGEGGSQHDHFSLYTAMADRTNRTARFDITFGVDFAEFQFQDCEVIFKKDAYIKPVLQSPDGTRWEIEVDDSGNLSTTSL
jgi:hypothetical protein